MSKRTISQELERQRLLILRIARYSNELKDLNAKIEKMRAGKAKVTPNPGAKIKIATGQVSANEFGDLIPSFGSGVAIE